MANRIILNETSYFGAGAIREIVPEVRGRGAKKVLVVTDSALMKAQVATKVTQVLDFFCDFYKDFDRAAAEAMLAQLQIAPNQVLKQMSKGTKEKVQLILAMSRKAKLYLLDEPIGGVDPATRDYILHTILTNYNPEAAVIISTHLIGDVEQILDEVVFLSRGQIALHDSCEAIREQQGKSVDQLFREVFKCWEN